MENIHFNIGNLDLIQKYLDEPFQEWLKKQKRGNKSLNDLKGEFKKQQLIDRNPDLNNLDFFN